MEADDSHSKPPGDVGDNLGDGADDKAELGSSCPRLGRCIDQFMGAVVILNVAVMIIDVDSRSLCDGMEACTDTARLTHSLNNVFLVIYFLELVGRIYVLRWQYFKSYFNLLDIFIVAVGVFDLFGSDLPNLQMLRLFRLVRISRVAKLLRSFPMLMHLFRGLRAAIVATLWGYILIVMFLMIWSLIAVEVLQPVNRTLNHSEGDWCGEAFESVVRASLYFFQTLIAGDSWGTCAIPIMQSAPYTYFVFAGAQASVNIGFMNLVLAVIVDSASSANAANEEEVIRDKATKTLAFTSKLKEALEKADTDKSGCISWEEMVEGYRNEPDVKKTFKLLDIEEHDLETFFDLMGNSGGDVHSGHSLSYARFVEELQKAQLQDPRIYMMMVKLQMQRMTTVLQEMAARPGPRIPGLRGGAEAEASIASRGAWPDQAPSSSSEGHGHSESQSGGGPRAGSGPRSQSGGELDSIWRGLESQIELRLRELAKEVVDYAAGASQALRAQCSKSSPPARPCARASSRRVVAPAGLRARRLEPREFHKVDKPCCSREEPCPVFPDSV